MIPVLSGNLLPAGNRNGAEIRAIFFTNSHSIEALF
jgi:hypothetical protein